ncbi:MAG: PD40 domain-containing protein, partial [Deltaproteobacteria bacterium]|nr:PD40 domain-containing protein [Deltaproteobacteria bacterium]
MDRCKPRTSMTWPGFGMIVLLLASGLFLPFSSEAVITTRVSVASDGSQGNDYSNNPSISADGRFVAFRSLASNFVLGDTNGKEDIFVHDRQTGQISRISVTSDGTEGNDHSYSPSISTDGRFVAFTSYASNLVHGDTNGKMDI